MNKAQLQEEYLQYINQILPEISKSGVYPVIHNHCWARIVLDNICGKVWYDVIAKPAYKNLSEVQLEQAIAMTKQIVGNPEYAHDLNSRSLQIRRTRKRSR
jgi:hypothetical protein